MRKGCVKVLSRRMHEGSGRYGKRCFPALRRRNFRCPKPFLGELSSVGSERLPYKQRVGGSNPSAPTPEAFHESERLFSYIHLPSFRLYPPPSQISHQRPCHVKHQGSKRALFSKIHIAHPKRREKHLFGVHKQNTIAKDIQRDNGGWGQGNKKPPQSAEVSVLGYQDSNLE